MINVQRKIIHCYKNRPIITKTNENFKNIAPFDFRKPTLEDKSLIKNPVNPRKAAGPDRIPLKVIKFDSNVIDSHLCNITIKDLEKNKFQKSK